MGLRRGTTLVELLIATVFLGICVGSILSCVTTSQARATQAKRRTTALRLAETTLETARGNGRTISLPVIAVAPTVVSLPGAKATLTTVTSLVGAYTDLYQVSATVTWTERTWFANHTESVKLVTYVRSPGA